LDRKALAAIQETLEDSGIEFLHGDAPGLRLHRKKAEMKFPDQKNAIVA
jgi:hypothetical protein